ncbi:14529_t:CDS:2 [Gigaspora margarita]|uniref:14529_t:CDS:1 n=1 Tax=Gigaspora margarita TaxID=4874 RepID=A0ABN7UMB2_GIGMA|nr:14529_t:CDS:2 [Gigaspora margarita]
MPNPFTWQVFEGTKRSWVKTKEDSIGKVMSVRTTESVALIHYYTTVSTTNKLVLCKGCSWAEESLEKQKYYISQAIRSLGTVHVDSNKKVHSKLEDISIAKSRLTDGRELIVKNEPMMIIATRLQDAFSDDKEMFEVKSVGSSTGVICFEIQTLTQKIGTHTIVKCKIKGDGDLHVLEIQNATWPILGKREPTIYPTSKCPLCNNQKNDQIHWLTCTKNPKSLKEVIMISIKKLRINARPETIDEYIGGFTDIYIKSGVPLAMIMSK